MKEKYDIRINPPKLSSEDIAKHKDFAALLKRAKDTGALPKQAPKAKNSWLPYAAAGGMALLIATASYFALSQLYTEEALKQEAQGFVLQKHQLETAKPLKLQYLEIALAAQETQTISYASLQHPLEYVQGDFAQGNEAEAYSLKAAFYLDVQNEQADILPLQAAEDQVLEYRKTTADAWQILALASTQSVEELLKSFEQQRPKPQSPKQEKAYGPLIEVDFNAADFPELADFGQDVNWRALEVVKDNWLKETWESMELQKEKQNYYLLFKNEKQSLRFKAFPISKNKAAMQKLTEQREQTYKEELAAWEAEKLRFLQEAKPSKYSAKTGIYAWSKQGQEQALRRIEKSEKRLQLPEQSKNLQSIYVYYPQQQLLYKAAKGQSELPLLQGQAHIWSLDAQGQYLLFDEQSASLQAISPSELYSLLKG